ncbi:MAG TPA: hypothetical protein VFU44_11930 [Candidatus Limnocylindria bacterium]|jgi:hypothetical protein|nr:hypothetical protein [Candidatus Limnocylindria bacterium]
MSERSALATRLAPLLLVVALAAALLAGLDDRLMLESADDATARAVTAAFDAMPDDALVLVGFDPDVGTYAEIRPTVRAVLADLLNRGATLAVVSLTTDGRALAIAELARMDRAEANPRQLIDLGFLPGAEAALVALARGIDGASQDPIRADLPSAPDLAVVIGGIDLGPRSWVEQVQPRIDGMPIVAVAPTVLLPELEPYRASGQLAALIGTPRDGAAYRAHAELGRLERMVDPSAGPSPAAILLGLLVAIGVLGQAFGSRLAAVMRAARPRDVA